MTARCSDLPVSYCQRTQCADSELGSSSERPSFSHSRYSGPEIIPPFGRRRVQASTRRQTRYRELRTFTSRFFNKIKSIGGFVFYVGIKKTHPPSRHNPNRLYATVLVEAIKRLDEFCQEGIQSSNNFLLVLDEHGQRSTLITEASRSMYGGQEPRRHLIEPPSQAESHRYQTLPSR